MFRDSLCHYCIYALHIHNRFSAVSPKGTRVEIELLCIERLHFLIELICKYNP